MVALTPVFGVGAIAVLEIFKISVYMTMGIVFASAIFSWVNPYAPMAAMVNQFAQPLLRPFQRVIPPIGGVDLSPLALLLALQVLLIVVGSVRASLMPLLYGG